MKVKDILQLGLGIVILILLLTGGIAGIFWLTQGGNTVSQGSIEELRIETPDASIHIKGLHTEISNYQIQQFLDAIKTLQ